MGSRLDSISDPGRSMDSSLQTSGCKWHCAFVKTPNYTIQSESCNKCVTLIQDVNNKRNGSGELSVLSAHFFCKYKTKT